MAELSAEALDSLSLAISERLQAVVPERASPDVGATKIRWQLDGIVNQPGDPEDWLVLACANILNDAQDQIVRDLKEGWPRAIDGAPGKIDSGKDLPEAEAAVVSGTLRLWYGDAWRPALELPPIRLDGLGLDVQ